jgi:hypothetical protein
MGIKIRIGGLKLGTSGSQNWTPLNLVASVVSNTAINLTWTGGKLAKVERSTDGVNYTQIGTGTDSYSDTGLNGNYYYYRVKGSIYSNVASNAIPLNIYKSDSVLWTPISDISIITKDGSNKVSIIADKLGSGHNLLQATGAKQPTWSAGEIASISPTLMKTAPFTLNQPEHIFLVIKQTNWTLGNTFLDGNANTTGFIYQTGTIPEIGCFAGTLIGGKAVTKGTVCLIEVVFNGVSSKLTINNYNTITGNAGASNMGGVTLGAIASGASNYADFSLLELLIKNAEITGADRTDIRNYFRNKFNLKNNITGAIGIVGDSTVATYAPFFGVKDYLYPSVSVTDVSAGGNTILQQNTAFNALASGVKSAFNYVFVQTGLNDSLPAESAATALGRYQTLINDINTASPSAFIVVGTMTPCKQRLIDGYGAVNGLVSYQKWLDMNEAIKGNGVNAITGVDARAYAHTDLLNDGNGNLAAPYDTHADGLHIHENNAGRQIVADSWFIRI